MAVQITIDDYKPSYVFGYMCCAEPWLHSLDVHLGRKVHVLLRGDLTEMSQGWVQFSQHAHRGRRFLRNHGQRVRARNEPDSSSPWESPPPKK
jgi:hypothetical protein